MKSAVALILGALLVQDKAPVRNTWAGFPDGSWVVIETTESADGKTAKKKHRHVVDHLADGAVVCQVNEETDVPAIMFEERTIQPGRGVEQDNKRDGDGRTEVVEIGGKKYDCTLQRYSSPEANANGKQAVNVYSSTLIKVPYREWDPAELTVTPGRIVHSGGAAVALDSNTVRYAMSRHDPDYTVVHQFRVVELGHKLKLADREILCVVEEATIDEKGEKGATVIKLKRWLSDTIPGRVVRSEMKGEVRGVKVERIRQVVSFKIADR